MYAVGRCAIVPSILTCAIQSILRYDPPKEREHCSWIESCGGMSLFRKPGRSSGSRSSSYICSSINFTRPPFPRVEYTGDSLSLSDFVAASDRRASPIFSARLMGHRERKVSIIGRYTIYDLTWGRHCASSCRDPLHPHVRSIPVSSLLNTGMW